MHIIDSANASGDKEIAELSAELVTLSPNSVLDSFDNLLAAGKDATSQLLLMKLNQEALIRSTFIDSSF